MIPIIEWLIMPLLGFIIGIAAFTYVLSRPLLAVWALAMTFFAFRLIIELGALPESNPIRIAAVMVLWTIFIVCVSLGHKIIIRNYFNKGP